jgi:hypothetical protein
VVIGAVGFVWVLTGWGEQAPRYRFDDLLGKRKRGLEGVSN